MCKTPHPHSRGEMFKNKILVELPVINIYPIYKQTSAGGIQTSSWFVSRLSFSWDIYCLWYLIRSSSTFIWLSCQFSTICSTSACASAALSSCLMFVLLDRISHVSAVHQASCCSAHLFPIISSASWPVPVPASPAAPYWLTSLPVLSFSFSSLSDCFSFLSFLYFACLSTFSSWPCPVCC